MKNHWYSIVKRGPRVVTACPKSFIMHTCVHIGKLFLRINNYIPSECSTSVDGPFLVKAMCKSRLVHVSYGLKHASRMPFHLPFLHVLNETPPITFQHCSPQERGCLCLEIVVDSGLTICRVRRFLSIYTISCNAFKSEHVQYACWSKLSQCYKNANVFSLQQTSVSLG